MSGQTLTLATQLAVELESEIQGHECLLERLAAQRVAVLEGPSSDVERAGAELERELDLCARRAARRSDLMAGLARELGVPQGTLTVGVLCERLAPAGARIGERLLEKRDRLHALAADVARDGRRVSTLVTRQRRLVEDLLGAILAPGTETELHDSGSLIDARA